VTFEDAFDLAVRGFEAFGVAILVVGSLAALAGYARDLGQIERTRAYTRLRETSGGRSCSAWRS
jgi:hypothetical protein